LIEARETKRSRLRQRIGAWYWKHKVNRQQRRKRWKTESPGILGIQARGINSRGDIVGTFGGGHSFLFSGGTFTVTDVPGAIATRSRGINARGDISGNYDDSSGNTHGFLLTR
jgi:hypothetical protein